MKTKDVTFVLFLTGTVLYSTFCKSQINVPERSFIRIEIEHGPLHSLRFFEEGLLCKTADSNLTQIVEFFPKTMFNSKKLLVLENYLSGVPSLLTDTIIDNKSIILNDDNQMVFSIITNNHLYTSIWIDGECNYLEKCLQLLNDVIPAKKQEIFKIKFYHG